MDNNDILIRLRYALDIKDVDMITIFEFGGIEMTKETLAKMLIRSKDSYHEESMSHNPENDDELEDNIKCDNKTLGCFLDGFIIFKRGVQELKPGEVAKPKQPIKEGANVNNIMLKKLKIAMAMSSDDVLETLKEGGVIVSKGELGAIFRKEGHKNYKECGDNFARKFLRGLSVQHRT